MTETQTLTSEPWIEIVRRKIGTMRFGSVQIVVHEGRVTQVEATEKTRLPAEGGAARPGCGESPRERQIHEPQET